MFKKIDKTPSVFKNMSNLKKIFIVFVILLIFIIIVEQPGSNKSKQEKNAKFFIPKMITEDVIKIGIQKPNTKEVILEKRNGNWQVNDGQYFPANKKRMNDFLNAVYNLKEGEVVSKNPDRMSIYSVDEKSGIKIRIWDNKQKKIADFLAGKYDKQGQFIRDNESNTVFYTNANLISFLLNGADSWKDKIILSLEEDNVAKIAIKNSEEEIYLEKYRTNEWNVVRPAKYKADKNIMNNLFVQLKKIEANTFASLADSKKVNFQNPNYQLAITLTDNSLQTILFILKDEDGKEYYVKNSKSDLIYILSNNIVDKIFGLNFKSAP